MGRAGLGLRRDLVDDLLSVSGDGPAFVEVAPENWMQVGGHWRKALGGIAERYPLTCHGLSLSLGSPEELDWNFLKDLKSFLREFPVQIFSEHLSYTKCGNAHLYDLLPIPFREDAVKHAALRIREVQDFLEQRISVENVSYYSPVAPELSEVQFISAVVREANCGLLLDVNNVYVNAFNHGYDGKEFIAQLPLDHVTNIHMAGHEQRTEDLIIDTHGQPIIDPVYDLFDWAIKKISPVPVLLERDFNFPDFSEIERELGKLDSIIDAAWADRSKDIQLPAESLMAAI